MFCINKRKTGSRYEEQAAAFLEKQGLLVIEKNFRCKSGEIDLIARDGRYLVFIGSSSRLAQTETDQSCSKLFSDSLWVSGAAMQI